MDSERFRDHLDQLAPGLWEAIYALPFVREVGAGSLEPRRFAYFIGEDLRYLDAFAQVLARGATKAAETWVQQLFLRHAQNVFAVEESLHSELAPRLGIDAAALRSGEPAPVTLAYTDHLRRVAAEGTLGELVAAVLPCYWVYQRVGQRLNRQPPDHETYRAWIASYAAPEFGRAVREQLDLVDRLGEQAGAAERRRMERWFLRSLRYEWMFWDQAYRLLSWPVTVDWPRAGAP